MPSTIHLPREPGRTLPPICVATGATEGVSFRATNFVFIPVWGRLSVVFCGLVGVIILLVTMQRARIELPFTDEAYEKWVGAKRVFGVWIVGALAILLGTLLLSPTSMMVGLVLFLLALVGAIVFQVTVVKPAGPECKFMDATTVRLEIPSQAAASAIGEQVGSDSRLRLSPETQQHLTGTFGALTDAEPRADAELDAEKDAELERRLQAELDEMR